MINTMPCEECLHEKICCKKENYKKFDKEIGNLCIIIGDKSIWFAKNCDDVTIELKCNHFLRQEWKSKGITL